MLEAGEAEDGSGVAWSNSVCYDSIHRQIKSGIR